MSNPTNSELIKLAKGATKRRKASSYMRVGSVGCALVTDKGNVYTGVNIVADCAIGLCAENSAIISMITNGEYKIERIVAVHRDGTILPPCGRCREVIFQANKWNYNTKIILDKSHAVRLKELLPDPWQEKRPKSMRTWWSK